LIDEEKGNDSKPMKQENRPYAEIQRRLLAFGIDYCVIASYPAALTAISAFLIPAGALRPLFSGPTVGQASAFFLVTLPVVSYFALMESSSLKGTLGKRILGLAVVTADGARLTRRRALGRAALKFLPWELSHTCLWRIPGWPNSPQEPPWPVYAGFGLVWSLIGVYVLSAILSNRRQALYDRISRCVVIRETQNETALAAVASVTGIEDGDRRPTNRKKGRFIRHA
jgi:uncharacterized RDD family membrane protein YckC